MSKVIGFVVGAVEIGIGIYTGNVALIVQGSLTIAAQAAVDLTAPKNPARDASELTVKLGEQPRVMLAGKCWTPGSLVDVFTFGGKYGTDWEVQVIRLADERCHALVQFQVNDTFYDYTGDGNYPVFDDHHFQLYFRSDTSSQPLPAIVTANGPGWTADDIGRSGCDVIVAYLADSPTAKHPAWPGGRPTFGFLLEGGFRYDPRKDDTVSGGSGAHRWEDATTWEYSENLAVCRYNWARGIYADAQVTDPSQLLIGRGLSAAEAPPINVFAEANLCDETMPDGRPRYAVGGPIYANQEHREVEQMFADACAGQFVTREGSVEIEPGQAKSIVATITDDDIIVGSKVGWNHGFLSEGDDSWINTVVANYIEPAQKWQPHDAPVVRSTADILADGKPREAQLSLRLVHDQGQALRVAEIQRRLGRKWGRGQVTLAPRNCRPEDGDWIAWQSDTHFQGAAKTFRIEAYSIDQKWQPTWTLREIGSDVYGDDGVFNADESSPAVATPPPIDVGAPDAANWTLAAITIDQGGVLAPALKVAGSAADDDFVQQIIVEYWKSDGVIDPIANPDDPPWTMEGPHPPSTAEVDITGVEGGASYYVAITYIVSGISGDRLVLGPAAVPATDVSGAVEPIVGSAVAALTWQVAVRAKTAAALPANTYANGSSGVGATLTATANGALAAVDGVTLAANDRLLVDQEATGAHNGIYTVTQLGDATHPYILTRASDADEAGELVNATVKVSEGASFADQEWQCTTNGPITIGTTAPVWQPASSLRNALVAGSNVTVTDNGDGTYTVASTGGGAGTFSGAKVRKSATLTGQNLSGAPTCTFNSEDWDTDGYHDSSSNTDRLTVPSAGKYAVYGNLKLNNVSANNYIAIQLGRYNSGGVLQEVLATTNNMIAPAGAVACSTAGSGNFSSGDYAMMVVFSVDTNTDIHTDTTFEIRKLS